MNVGCRAFAGTSTLRNEQSSMTGVRVRGTSRTAGVLVTVRVRCLQAFIRRVRRDAEGGELPPGRGGSGRHDLGLIRKRTQDAGS
jgi:hypothetical protein